MFRRLVLPAALRRSDAMCTVVARPERHDAQHQFSCTTEVDAEESFALLFHGFRAAGRWFLKKITTLSIIAARYFVAIFAALFSVLLIRVGGRMHCSFLQMLRMPRRWPWCCLLEDVVVGKPRVYPGGLLVTRAFGDFSAKVLL